MRQLPPLERIDLRDKLIDISQSVSQTAAALDPLKGRLVLTDEQFKAAVYDLIGALERLKV